MCNIAGYVGTKQAAPILLDLIEKQEGLAGGYYTGIATYNNGKIYYQKLVGDTKRLVKNTDASLLPGTIGIIHSRSKSGGGQEWAHPFIGAKNGETEIAYVANGDSGIFNADMQKCSELVQKLDKAGYTMSSVESDNKNYPMLSDSRRVHMSDAMCQLILSKIDEGIDEEKAMELAYCQMPGEIVGLMLSLKNPDRIFYSRINMSMTVGFAHHGAYLATAPMVLPDDSKEPVFLPTLSSGYVKKDGFFASPYEKPPTDVTALDNDIRNKVYNCVIDMLKAGPKAYLQLEKEVGEVFDKQKCNPYTAALYEVLYYLKKQNKISLKIERCDGAFADYDAPKTIIALK